jgi:AraC-like DNA-binding protein
MWLLVSHIGSKLHDGSRLGADKRERRKQTMAYHLPKLFDHIDGYLDAAPNLSLAELSDRIGVGRHTIKKAVKKATGKTFRQFRNTVLLEKAGILLTSAPNRTIKEIAYSLGYQSQRSFSRFVRQATGYSPKQLRRECKRFDQETIASVASADCLPVEGHLRSSVDKL